MKNTTKSLFAFGAALLLAIQGGLAGEDSKFEKTQVPPPEESAPAHWNAQLTEGWDSLYMFRGVNRLRGNMKYGSSILWTDLNVTFHATDSDAFTVDVWNGFGLYRTSYKETDASLTYTHTFGNLFASLGYKFYALTADRQYANEILGKLGYNIVLGSVIVTPSVSYFFDLGPNASTDVHGRVPSASSYLDLRVDTSIPIYKDVVYLMPWIAYGQNFRYNAHDNGSRIISDNSAQFFNGANNLELGIALPIKINRYITVSGYGAYSYAFNNLIGTSPSTFWGGAKVTLGF